MSRFYKFMQKAETPKTLDLYIYSDVEGDGRDWWTGEVIESETSANYFRDRLAEAGDVEQINIYINSLGGSVMEGVAIYNQLRRHKAHKTVYIDGFACSVASVIACAGDTVIMPRNATMMVHDPWTVAIGNAKELRKAADDLDKIAESSLQAYVQKAAGKLTEEKAKELLGNETYLTAEECISYGLADEYAEADIDIEAAIAALTASGDSAKQRSDSRYGKVIDRLKERTSCGSDNNLPAAKPMQDKALFSEKANNAAGVPEAKADVPNYEAAVPYMGDSCPESEGVCPADTAAGSAAKDDFSAIAGNIINKFFNVKE